MLDMLLVEGICLTIQSVSLKRTLGTVSQIISAVYQIDQGTKYWKPENEESLVIFYGGLS